MITFPEVSESVAPLYILYNSWATVGLDYCILEGFGKSFCVSSQKKKKWKRIHFSKYYYSFAYTAVYVHVFDFFEGQQFRSRYIYASFGLIASTSFLYRKVVKYYLKVCHNVKHLCTRIGNKIYLTQRTTHFSGGKELSNIVACAIRRTWDIIE
jgi:hypothetical protein